MRRLGFTQPQAEFKVQNFKKADLIFEGTREQTDYNQYPTVDDVA